ncbi:MAG: T9SS type A sorting domain-containing protein [Flavobacteriales bacterium]|nr:T9SS type A sorting domain-containing protein [Flavobacteriales bacterium]
MIRNLLYFSLAALLIIEKALLSHAQCNLNPTITPSSVMFCPNAVAETLQTQNYQTYQWFIFDSYNHISSPISGATGQQLIIDPINYIGLEVYVKVSDGICTDSSETVFIDGWVFLPPFVMHAGDQGTIGSNGEQYMNCGDTTMLILMPPYTEQIQWYNYGNPIPGATNDTLIITQTGHYTCSGAPAVCPDYLQQLGVVIEIYFPNPTIPVITLENGILHASGNGTFQWYLNGQPINGANQNTLVPLQNGTYTVTIMDDFQCETESEPFILNNLSMPQILNELYLNVYPNPIQTHLMFENLSQEKQYIRIINAYGQLIQEIEMMAREVRLIFMLNYAPGIYLIQCNHSSYHVIKQ